MAEVWASYFLIAGESEALLPELRHELQKQRFNLLFEVVHGQKARRLVWQQTILTTQSECHRDLFSEQIDTHIADIVDLSGMRTISTVSVVLGVTVRRDVPIVRLAVPRLPEVVSRRRKITVAYEVVHETTEYERIALKRNFRTARPTFNRV